MKDRLKNIFNLMKTCVGRAPYTCLLAVTALAFGILVLAFGGSLPFPGGEIQVINKSAIMNGILPIGDENPETSDRMGADSGNISEDDAVIPEDGDTDDPGYGGSAEGENGNDTSAETAADGTMASAVEDASASADSDSSGITADGDRENENGGAEEEEEAPVDLGLFDYTEDSGYAWVNIFNNGITPVDLYEPGDYGSRYFDDLGISPETTQADYTKVDMDYFEDACFIGDSRCLGVNDYSGFPCDFYCDNGYCFYTYSYGKKVTCQNTHTKVDLEQALEEKKYSKIYVMMGINDCGYGTTNTMRDQVGTFIDMLETSQPDAIIFLCANMHISRSAEAKSDPGVYCIPNINAKNLALASFADGKKIFYLDYNSLFCDDEGYLIDEYTFDGYHLYGADYEPWVNFFLEHGIVDAAD